MENVTIKLACHFSETVSTGFYLPAGIIAILNVVSGDFKGWSIRIGAHADNLANCDKLMRWPCVTTKKPMESQLNISSAFGGLVYFESPGAGELTVNMSNLVESPFFDLANQASVNDWLRRRRAPGLWVITYKFDYSNRIDVDFYLNLGRISR